MFRTTQTITTLLALGTLGGQAPIPGPAAAQGEPVASSQADRSDRARRAEELLDELRRRRPEPAVIPPASAAAANGKDQAPRLLPEGTAVVDEVAALQAQQGWWVADMEDASRPDWKLLPNATLEAMGRMARSASGPLRFAISGELTVFEGENYLLVRSAIRKLAAEPGPRDAGQEAAEKAPESVAGDAEPPTATKGDDAAMAWDAAAEDVLERMRDLAAEMPAFPPDQPSTARPEGRRAVSTVRFLEGTALAARTGRLVPDGDGWALAFDSNNPASPETALRMLPNRALEFMVADSRESPIGLTFIVSGEITEFDGRNYLLVRTVRRPTESGNLRK